MRSVVTPESSRAAEIWKSSQEEKEEEKRPMTRLTRRELLIGGTAIVAAGALPRTAFAAETAEYSGFPRDTNRKGEHFMTSTRRSQDRLENEQVSNTTSMADRDVTPSLLTPLEWRSIGPYRGGRVVAVAGDTAHSKDKG